jgi:hypothetical protein
MVEFVYCRFFVPKSVNDVITEKTNRLVLASEMTKILAAFFETQYSEINVSFIELDFTNSVNQMVVEISYSENNFKISPRRSDLSMISSSIEKSLLFEFSRIDNLFEIVIRILPQSGSTADCFTLAYSEAQEASEQAGSNPK